MSKTNNRYSLVRGWALNYRIPELFFLFLLFTMSACRRPQTSSEISAQYQQDALQMCTAITECIAADVAQYLADQPEKRDLVLGRMKRDLCIRSQFQLIGDLGHSDTLYRNYSACSRTIAGASDCLQRKELHKNFPACQKLRANLE